jgi:nucleoside 2-deoxyribosyltransferase
LLKNYIKNRFEFQFYLKTLKDYGFIDFTDASSKDGPNAYNIKITFKGLEYIIDLQENGQNSKKCFIAMSFSNTEEISNIRKTLKSAIRKQGYEPILIDEMHYDSEHTINDAMLNFIKQSRFIVADFTEHKHGVYFEAGYALGLKRPVIYTCSGEYFKNTHFDTNHYPHIVYENLTDLEGKLINKIAAWID